MEIRRWLELEKSGDAPSEEEVKAGWHYCTDWDFMLVGPGMREWEGCTCERSKL